MTMEENKQIGRRAFEALMAGDLSRLQDLLTPNAVLHQCGFLEPIRARAILQGGVPGPARLTKREVSLERTIGEDDLVALHWRTTGRYSDPDSPEVDGKRQHGVEVLNVVDEGTSILLDAQVGADFHAETTLQAVADLFVRQGLPQAVRLDRDVRFVSSPSGSAISAATRRASPE